MTKLSELPLQLVFALVGLVAVSIAAGELLAQNELQAPAQPWAGAALDDWEKSLQSLSITDLSQAEPQSALSKMVLKPNRWKVIPYELTNGQRGDMVWAAPEANAPEISIALDTEGWHAIFVGLFAATEVPTMAWIRLDDDPAAEPRYNQRVDFDRQRNAYGNTEEVFFRAARLNKNSRLFFRPQNTGDVSGCGITHVKLIPLPAEEVDRIQDDQANPAHRVLAATNDGFSGMFYWSPRTKAELLGQIEPFRNTDFETLILQCPGADKVNYPSKIGFMKGSRSELSPRIGDRHFVESTRALAEQGINPIGALTKRAQEIGLKVHVGIRPAGWSFFEPYSDYWESPFYRDNPRWRCADREGTPVTRMSWAVPEVRRHMIELLGELVGFGADGVNIVFTRGYPLVLYESPARSLFREQYGTDLNDIPETDPRIVEFRSGIVTQFFEELREMLDNEQLRRGGDKRLTISVLVNATAQDDLFYGVDLPQLAKTKLVDAVFTEFGFGATERAVNLDLLQQACGPAQIPFSPGVYSGPDSWSKVPEFYARGAHGVTVWDAEAKDIFEWRWLCRFGHADETRWRLENLKLKNAPRAVYQFRKLGDQVRDGRYGPHWGG